MDRNKGLKKINHKFEMPPTFGDAVSLVDKIVPLEAEEYGLTKVCRYCTKCDGYGCDEFCEDWLHTINAFDAGVKLAEKISKCDEAIKRDIQRCGYIQEKYEDTPLDTFIRQDVEHGTFRAQNCFDDEYITPTFYRYAKELEREVKYLRAKLQAINEVANKD